MAYQSLRQRYPQHKAIPVLIVLSAVLLGFGLSLPLMNVGKMYFWQNDYSVITGIVGLFEEEEYFLSAILFIFCLIFPVLKLGALWVLWRAEMSDRVRDKTLDVLGMLGKWSMLDVFVVAILIVAVKLGPLATVKPRSGVYIFSVAIILSMLISTCVEGIIKRDTASRAPDIAPDPTCV